jgi:hypothetical protein
MKLKIETSKEEVPVTLFLEEGPSGVTLLARSGGWGRRLLTFNNDGTVSRPYSANIGDFKFNVHGQIEIN